MPRRADDKIAIVLRDHRGSCNRYDSYLSGNTFRQSAIEGTKEILGAGGAVF